jgi:hypothetical protein
MCGEGPNGEECLNILCDANMLCCIEGTTACADCTATVLGEAFNPDECIP